MGNIFGGNGKGNYRNWSTPRLILFLAISVLYIAACAPGGDDETLSAPQPSITPPSPAAYIPYQPDSPVVQVDLEWQPMSGNIVSIEIERREAVDASAMAAGENQSALAYDPWIVIAQLNPDATSYSDTPGCGKDIEYRVCSVEGNGARACSPPVKVTAPICPPKDLTATLVAYGQVELAWTDNSDNELWFRIFRKGPADSAFVQVGSVIGDSTTFLDTDVPCGATYQYKVQAANYEKRSGYSNEASVSTQTCPACMDGVDNDGDTFIDYPDDVGCSDFLDDYEGGHWSEIGAGSASGGGISNTGRFALVPSLAIDTAGNPVVAWEDYTPVGVQIYLRRWNGGSWVEVGTGSASGRGISDSNGLSSVPSLALDSNDAPVVAWKESAWKCSQIFIKRWDGSAWVEIGDGSASGGGISNAGLDTYSVFPSLAIDLDDNPIVAWGNNSVVNDIYIKHWDGNAWVEMGAGSASDGGISNSVIASQFPSLALDSSGNPAAAWYYYTPGLQIYVKRWDGSVWVEFGTGSASGGGISNTSHNSAFPSIAFDSNDNPIVAWNDDSSGNHEIYIRRLNGNNWVEVGTGSASGGGISNTSTRSLYPSLAIDSNNNPVVAWCEDYKSDSMCDDIYIKRWDGNAWVEIGTGSASGGGISKNNGFSQYPSLAFDSNGIPFVAWDDNTSGNDEIYIKRWVP